MNPSTPEPEHSETHDENFDTIHDRESQSEMDTTELNDTQDIESNQSEDREEDFDLNTEQRLQAEIVELREKVLRKSAEMENMRKRIQRDRVQLFDQSKAAALEAFLPVNDDLQRTLDALKTSNPDPAFLEGIQLVADKFSSVLESFGVEKISETYVPFDINIHEALLRQPAPNSDIDSDTVLQVLENGYRIGEKVLRHAKVIVSE